jgi:Raf kinase inhibitor-like YbhB/YbcL family protein
VEFQLKVDGFSDGDKIPGRFTCEGADTSPALTWSGAPPESKSFALIIDDPDAPSGTWNHWLLWDIPATVHSLKSGYQPTDPVQAGKNDFGKQRYNGPCPQKGHGEHRYFFRLFALDVETLKLPVGANRARLDALIDRHTLAMAEYMGLYSR